MRAAHPSDVLGLVMLAFDGFEVPDPIARRLAETPAAGVTLFRYYNVDTPAQVRELTDGLQRAARARNDAAPPLLIAADQEGGQLVALGEGTTPFAGNMALGAAGDEELTGRVGRAIGLECAALGVNVAHVPVCDLADNAANPGIGIRSFGSQPGAVAGHVAAFVRGVRSAGVAATAKHFPGLGNVTVDSHVSLAALPGDRARLEASELVPFRAAIDAGVDVVMSAHVAVPALSADGSLPATLSAAVMRTLLRERLGFRGVAITDALDMRALPQGGVQALDALAALRAGVDLLLLAPDTPARLRIEEGIVHGTRRGFLERRDLDASLARVSGLRRRLATSRAVDLDVVASGEHLALAREVAERSVTLVRDDKGILPLRLGPDARVAAVMPRPVDLTPADTSSRVPPGLAAALARHVSRVDEIVVGHSPTPSDVPAVLAATAASDVVVVGTVSASLDLAQAELVRALVASGVAVVTVALRTPFDLAAYPDAPTHLCTYGLLPPSLDALADVLFGVRSAVGRLPTPIPGLFPAGHRLEPAWA